MTYQAKQSPVAFEDEKLKALSEWVYGELKELEQNFFNLDRIRCTTLFVEPTKKRDGDVVFADGTEWNPGNGQGLYVYRNGAWVKLENTANGTITGSVGSTDNRLVRSSGTSGTVIDSTGITVNDSNDMSGVGALAADSLDLTTALPISEGGTGQTTQTAAFDALAPTTTQGDISYHNGTDNVRLAAGTAGQFLQTQGAGANPQWANGGMVLLNSGTVTNAATLDIVLTSYTAYRGLLIFLSDFLPQTDADELYIRFSTDGGSTYDATGYNYAYMPFPDVTGGTQAGSGSANQIEIATNVGNASTEGYSGEITLLNQTSASRWSKIYHRAYYISSAATPGGVYISGGGAREAAQDTDAIRFSFSSGQIASGIWAIYGLA